MYFGICIGMILLVAVMGIALYRDLHLVNEGAVRIDFY